VESVLEGVVATSKRVERTQICFNTETGLILKVGNLGIAQDQVDYFYDDDCLIFAGMGDVHIHAREDKSKKHIYKEDFFSSAQAALHGGVTHVSDMPNNPIPPIDDVSYREKLALTLKSGFPFFLYAGIGPGTSPLTFTIPYKAYMGPSVGELFFKNNEELEDVLEAYRGQFVSFHCEDPEILEECKGLSDHELRRPVRAEVMATKKALELIEKYELKGKLCHYSSKEGLPKILEAKKRGFSVECEVTPQHLYFNQNLLDNSLSDKKTFMQMNPPIRSIEDQEFMLESFLRGDIDYLATDHAPHTWDEKEKGTSGLPGLDTYGGFVTWLLVEKKMDPKLVSLACSEKPGRFVNNFLPSLRKCEKVFERFGKGFGFVVPGHVASFTVLNLKRPWTVKKADLNTKAQWSPFLDITFPGSVESVFFMGSKI
jgi:dihydroorotase